jgi:hypothetical protein
MEKSARRIEKVVNVGPRRRDPLPICNHVSGNWPCVYQDKSMRLLDMDKAASRYNTNSHIYRSPKIFANWKVLAACMDRYFFLRGTFITKDVPPWLCTRVIVSSFFFSNINKEVL